MNETQRDPWRSLLAKLASGQATIDETYDALAATRGFERWALGRFDTERERRTGVPEAIYAAGKTPAEIADAFERALDADAQLIATRLAPHHLDALSAILGRLTWHERARIVSVRPPDPDPARPRVLVVSAGASDEPVAAEAAHASALMGNPTSTVRDVGVAGIHRLFAELDSIRAADILLVVAGMEGALPSVVGGLTSAPMIALPTSVGYGASFGGLAALLGMLNSCAPGATVVNIDNGFGAAAAATRIALAIDAARASPG